MMFYNKYVQKLKPYSLVSHKAWELKDTKNVLKLDWNEATIQPSPKVKENIIKFLENGNLSWYPDVNNKILLNEISKYVNLPLENIQYFASSDSLHEYIAKAFVETGDSVLMIAPTYDNFRSTFEASGAEIAFYTLLEKDKFEINLSVFNDYLLKNKPKIVYICSPNNPTGTVYTNEQIKFLISQNQDIFFVIDEAYCEFSYHTCKDLVKEFENILICRTFSKAFGLASFRIGYALSSKQNLEFISKIRNPKNISTISQIAAISALKDIEYMQKYANDIKNSKKFFDDKMREMGYDVFGVGGNFTLIKINLQKKKDFIEFLEKNGIFVRDYGHVKDMQEFLRITIGTKEQMSRVLEVICSYGR